MDNNDGLEFRRQKFSRANSADKPTSDNISRAIYALPTAFTGDCSTSCPPTVPTTPTRSHVATESLVELLPPPIRAHCSAEPLGQTAFQCECLEEHPPWKFESGIFDKWCAPCTKRRPAPATRWSSFDLSSPPQMTFESLPQKSHELNNIHGSKLTIGGSRLNITNSRLNLSDSLIRAPPPPPSIWDCLVSCTDTMAQRLARKRVEEGVLLYNQQKHLLAVKKWKQALRRIRKDNDRFVTLGYIAQAHFDWGRYREMLDYGFQQLDIANELDSAILRAEAYLTLARGNERLGYLEKALSYCRHSLFNQCDQSRVTGNVHIVLGHIYTTFSVFCKSVEHFELAHKVSRVIQDSALEFQVYCGLSTVFCQLQDFEKALSFGAKALQLAKGFQIAEFNSKFQRMALICLATPLRKLSRIHEAIDCCQDALKLAAAGNDRPVHARGLLILADVYRQCLDVQRAYKRYEASMILMNNMEDKHGQLLVMNGIAKILGVMRRQGRICDCRPLDINNKVIDIAATIGCKIFMRSAHLRLANLYSVLEDDENERLQIRLLDCLTEEMELVCGVCRDTFGDIPGNSVEVLPCSHIFHTKCMPDLLSAGDRKKKNKVCPNCSKSVNSRIMMLCYDDLKAGFNDRPEMDTSLSGLDGLNGLDGLDGLDIMSPEYLIPPPSDYHLSPSYFRSSFTDNEPPL